jgi:2OG-Fe(II) oxygenase superfamily
VYTIPVIDIADLANEAAAFRRGRVYRLRKCNVTRDRFYRRLDGAGSVGTLAGSAGRARHLHLNIGDCLMRWSNDVYVSTPHKVVSPLRKDRYAVAFLLDPNPDAVVACLPTCTSSELILSRRSEQRIDSSRTIRRSLRQMFGLRRTPAKLLNGNANRCHGTS